ncbi:MAG TPA: phosphate starvation-inducible protein PhoH, partial [Lachnoclostridium phytofermentans]|nr:phosphate starvation-inducible protein PhoH [Lachnoclostridium phytofermentans]
TSQDVVRHPLVQKIVKAYDEFEKRNDKRGANPTDNRGVKITEIDKKKRTKKAIIKKK